MIFSKKQVIFPESFPPFLKSVSISEHFERKKMILILYVIPKMQTAKRLVKQMPKKPWFTTPFKHQRLNESQTLVESGLQHF